jgi:3'-phosphoadenosine 5'-phosphosulfate sulfotransferase (PAPS reductase)/FAD synthetase
MKGTLDFDMALKHREAHDCSLVTMPPMGFWNSSNKTPEQKAHIIDRAQTLQAGIRMGYDQKCEHAEKVIRMALEMDQKWAVSYSGGRDSTVLSHIMIYGMGLTHVPHVMSNTRMEYPESVKMVNQWFTRLRALGVDCHTVFPAARPNVLWKEIGVPLWSKEIAYKYRKFARSDSDKISPHVPANLHDKFRQAKAAGLKITEKCCDHLKKKPMHKWDKTMGVTAHFTGVRCSESRARRLAWIQKGALYQAITHHNMWIANPLAFWTEDDVVRYLKDNELVVLKPDTVNGGSGCVTCLFGSMAREQEGVPNAMQDLKTRNPKMWKEALDGWGYREVLDTLQVPYE